MRRGYDIYSVSITNHQTVSLTSIWRRYDIYSGSISKLQTDSHHVDMTSLWRIFRIHKQASERLFQLDMTSIWHVLRIYKQASDWLFQFDMTSIWRISRMYIASFWPLLPRRYDVYPGCICMLETASFTSIWRVFRINKQASGRFFHVDMTCIQDQ